jgi:hypothetical protein
MTVVRRLLVLTVLVFLAAAGSAFASAANIYITQSGSPSGNCTTGVQTPAFFNAAANWGTGASQIGPGTTVLICGTFTGAAGATEFSFLGSGTSASPITLKFDTGASLTSPYWSGSNGAIGCSSKSYVDVDGGTNGVITNSANGTNQANQQQSFGVSFSSCTNVEIKNLTVKNIYINNGSSSSATDVNGQYTACIALSGTSTGSLVHNNTVSQCKIGVMVSADANGSAVNDQIYSNNISDMDWGINAGGGDSGDIITGLLIHDNTITNWTNWQYPTATMHQDGIILYNYATGSATLTASVYNNYIYGDLGVGSPTGFIYCAQNATCQMYNNLLVNTGHKIYGIIWVGTGASCSKLYNNTIVGLSGDFAITLGTGAITSGSCNPVIENNIVTGVSVGLNDYGTLASDVGTSNYNVWAGSPQMVSNDSTYLTFSTWQGEGFDAKSSTASPGVAASNPVPTTSSSAYNLGANLASLGIAALDADRVGTARPSSGTWTAGAYSITSGAAPTPPGNVVAIVKN